MLTIQGIDISYYNGHIAVYGDATGQLLADGGAPGAGPSTGIISVR